MGLPEPYVEICVLGHGINGPVMYRWGAPVGSYPLTCLLLARLARDTTRNVLVAVKRLYNPLMNQERAKFCFRELHLLNCLRHPNVLRGGGGRHVWYSCVLG